MVSLPIYIKMGNIFHVDRLRKATINPFLKQIQPPEKPSEVNREPK